MKKWLLLLLLVSINVTSCKNPTNEEHVDNNIPEEVEWKFGRKSSFVEGENGWYYVFTYIFEKEDLGDIGLIPYNFYGINLRYRYHDDYMTTVQTVVDGEVVTKTVPQTIQILGLSNSIKIKNDMDEIAAILKYSSGKVTNEELLSLTTDDLTFEEFDEELFLGLIQETLNGEAHKEGNYAYLPIYALLEEKDYLDNYKFQVGFINTQGCMDVVVIDVLYKTGSNYNDYRQLSDMVASGEATIEQIQLYEVIERISQGIQENNDFLYQEGNLLEIGDVDISRLYSVLADIENNEYLKYVVNPGE